jgi:hypothetical protein
MLIGHSSLLLFVTGAAIILLIPGPAVMYVVSRSIGHGRSAGLVSAMGIVVGTLFHVAAATLGLSALLASSAMAFEFVKYLGAAGRATLKGQRANMLFGWLLPCVYSTLGIGAPPHDSVPSGFRTTT